MDQTQTYTNGSLPADALERGKQVYDEIMGQIEQELMTDSLSLLSEKYKDETPEQATVRAARYDEAFVEYDKRYSAYMMDLGGKVRSFQRTVRAGIETDERKEEEATTTANLENSLSNMQ